MARIGVARETPNRLKAFVQQRKTLKQQALKRKAVVTAVDLTFYYTNLSKPQEKSCEEAQLIGYLHHMVFLPGAHARHILTLLYLKMFCWP